MSAPASGWKQWVATGLGFVYPEVCQVCLEEHATKSEGFVCAQCWQRVRFIRPPFCDRCGLPYEGDITTKFECGNCREIDFYFQFARSAVVAGEVVRNVIHRYKYERALWFEPFLADLLVREAGRELARGKWDMIVPVPLHPVKRREREFNQAERLGARLGQAVGIPLNTKALRRVEPTQTQTLLNRQERAANMKKAFALRPGAQIKGRRVVLVDDVFTTGATTSACAKVLIAAGAGEVCVWTVARGI
jgi:competence protein ComFC